jgi:WD40 repeat protein
MTIYSDRSNYELCYQLFDESGSDRISAIAAQDDKIYSASDKGTIIEWDLTTQTALRQLQSFAVRQLNISNNRLIGIPYGFDNQFVVEWDLKPGKIVREITFAKSVVTAALQGDHLYTTHKGSTKIEKWDINIAPSAHLLSFEGHIGRVFSLAIDNNNQLYSGSEDLSLRAWDCKTGANLWMVQINRHACQITALSQSVIFCTTDHHGYELDKKSHEIKDELRTNGGVLYSLTSAGNYLIAGSRVNSLSLARSSIRVWKRYAGV